MKKILLIFGVILASVLASGVFFLIGSVGSSELVDVPPESPAEETLQLAEFYQKQGRYEDAYSLLRQLLDMPLNSEMQRDITYRLGDVFIEDYRQNGVEVLDTAQLYLQAVFNTSKDDPDFNLKVGKKLLYIAAERQKPERFFELTDQLLSLELEGPQALELWQMKLDYLFESGLPWSEYQQLILAAEGLPAFGSDGIQLLKDGILRANERLLQDPEWFAEYVAETERDPSALKEALFEEVHRTLKEKIESTDGRTRAGYALRQGLAMASIGRVEEARQNLRLCLETSSDVDLVPALELIARLSGNAGDETELHQFVTRLLNNTNYSNINRREKLRIVELLSSLRRYEEALGVISVDLELADLNGGAEEILAKAVMLEVRQGRIDAARSYMDKLFAMGGGEPFGRVLNEFIDLQLANNQYGLVEEWGLRYLSGVPAGSECARDIYFALFEAAYWLKKPPLEKLFTGAVAVEANPNDERVGPVILRMADYVEKMGLHTLAGSYYNRIGLLSFFQENQDVPQPSRNISEQAMLGKARCLLQDEEWARVDHLLRDLCRRTASPLIRSELAVYWAELSLRFGQKMEAQRRYDLADRQLLPPALRARYLLGQIQLRSPDMPRERMEIESALASLEELDEADRRQVTIDFFNEMFDFLFSQQDERVIRRLIDLAYQSDYADLLPIQSYLLRSLFQDVTLESVGELNAALRQTLLPSEASMIELEKSVRRTEELRQTVTLHNKRSSANE